MATAWRPLKRAAAHCPPEGTPPFSVSPPVKTRGGSPLILIAPETPPNRKAIGFNLLSEARRSEAIEQARDRDDVVLSRRIELIIEDQFGGRQPGLLMVLPVHCQGMPTGTVDERRRSFTGVVIAGYRINDFMRSLNYANSGNLAPASSTRTPSIPGATSRR